MIRYATREINQNKSTLYESIVPPYIQWNGTQLYK